VEVYQWNGTDTWIQKGSSITYADTGDGFGPSVSISNDGNTIAIGIKNADIAEGAPADNAGAVYVYHWSGSAWGTPHTLIQPVTDDDDFGDHHVMSGDGKRIIVGASHADDGGTNSGRLYTFEYTGGSWVRREVPSVGADGGTNAYLGMGPSNSAHSHAISRDGSVIVAGESGFYTNGQAYSGRVRIYNMPSNIKSIWGSNDDVNWTKITTAPTREEATSNVAGLAFGYDDRLEFKNLDNPNYYKYHAIVADAFTTLKNIRLYGIREKASSTIHDGALTLTKNLVVPRIGPAFDADDTPRRDRLVVEYTTSTNPTDYGYVKDTSGNGYDAKMVGVVYNPSDKSFECSASDGSQWIETYIPNGSRFNTQFSVSVWANMGQFDLTSLYGFIFALGDRNQTGLSSTSGNELSLVYNHAGLTEGTFFTTIEGQNLFFKEFTTHDSHMGQWYHLVMTYDGSTLYLYKNGENSGYATRTAPVLPDDNCVVRLFGDAVNENATHQGVQSRISNFKLYDCCLTRDEARTLYDMGRCDEGHHVVSFEKTRVGIGLGDGCAPKAELDVRGTARIGPSGQQWRTSGDEGDRLIQFHSGQATSGQPTLEVTQYGGTRASPTPTVLQISNELGGGADWSTTEPYGMLSFANADGTGSGVAGPAASVGAVCDTVNGGGDTRLAFFTNSGISHIERMCLNHDGNVGIGLTGPTRQLQTTGTTRIGSNLGWSNQNSWSTNKSLQGPNAVYYGALGHHWSTYSSRRLKENIETVLDSLDKVKKLRGVYFTWKNGQGDNTIPNDLSDYDTTQLIKQQKQLGFIADEVGEVLPSIVTFDVDGHASGLDYSAVTPVLVNAIKELDDKIGKGEATSDDRLKDNEVYVENAIETIMKLKPQIYDKRESLASNVYHRESGLIAQDIWYDAQELRFAVKPGLLSEIPIDAPVRSNNPVKDPDYSTWGPNPASVDYNYLIPYVIKSIQEITIELPKEKVKVLGVTKTNIDAHRGLIVCASNGEFSISSVQQDKKCFGVISHSNTYSNNNEILVDTTGIGKVWVINTTDIESGDYLTSSSINGYAMKQSDEILRSYTLSKSMTDCNFSLTSTPIKRIRQELKDVTYYINTKLYDITKEQYDSLDELYRTSRENTFYTKSEYVKVSGGGGYDKLEYKRDDEVISSETWNMLESVTQNTYSVYYSNLVTTRVSLEDYSAIDETERGKCVLSTEIIYSYKIREESKSPLPGYEPEIRKEMVDILDANGQIMWEDDPSGATESTYEIRYLDADGNITDEANAVHTAALISCKYC
jgi:hypothetical protein